MSRKLVHFRDVVRRVVPLAIALAFGPAGLARADSPERKKAEAEKPKADPRLAGFRTPEGFKVRIVAAEPALVDPAAMTFDDQGQLYVAEWRPAERTFETLDTVTTEEGEKSRVRRTRKSSTDVVKKLKDGDGDGVFESSEVVLEGCEMPTSLFLHHGSLFLTCVGRLEKWSDDDGDGHYESRLVLLDGFAAMDRRGLTGATLGPDGWIYLATGDDDNHVVAPDGSRADLPRTGGLFRCKPDGSRLTPYAMGLRNPYKGLAFDSVSSPMLVDGDFEDGSKFQGLRLISPVEEGDYGWRLRAGRRGADFDRGAVDGELPGRLPMLARLARGSASGLTSFGGVAFPEALRDTWLVPDPQRRIVRGLKVERIAGGGHTLKGESTLLSSDDDQFRPIQVVVGADGSIYVLDQRGPSPIDRPPGGEGKAGRLYKITWEGGKSTPNHWDRVVKATTEEIVFRSMTSKDKLEADRAVLELIDRGPTSLVHFLGWSTNPQASLSTRVHGIQGARQLWSEVVEATFLNLLNDPEPEVRRLAAQALAWEPKSATARLVPKLLPHLDDADGRVSREVALAIGRHAEPRPQQASAVLFRWLLAHPQADPSTRDGFVRGLERLGDPGIEEVALAIRTRRGTERESAVAVFTAFRTAPAAEKLEELVKIPDLSTSERIALIRQFPRFPSDVPASTQGLADWVVKHYDIEPSIKIAALDACRISGNPASALVLSLLDDEEEVVREASSRIAARTRPPGSVEILIERLKAKETTASERLALVKALRVGAPRAFEALDAAYIESEDAEFRQAALASMAGSDLSKASPALESALSGPDPKLRSLAARLLGDSPRTAPLLAKAFSAGEIRREELPIVLTRLRKLQGPEARKNLASIEEQASSGPGALNPSEIRAKLDQGDPWAGLGVFFRESSRCSSCHQVGGKGRTLGPNLTLSPKSPPADDLIESILTPSKSVEARYEATRIRLKEGRSFVGMVESRDEKSLTLRESGGREIRIGRDLIESEGTERTSTMPPHVSLDLTPDELVDLVAFLRDKPAQSSLKHGPWTPDRAFAIGPFALGADGSRVPLDRVEVSRRYEGADGTSARWTPLDPTRSGMLNLRGQFGPGPGRAYLAIEVRSSADQSAALRLGVEGACRVYVNGSKVMSPIEHDPATLAPAFANPASNALAPLPDLARIKLKAGANLLLIAVDRAGDENVDVRAVVEIASPEPLQSRGRQD